MISGFSLNIAFEMNDIEQLNRDALNGGPDICKVSFATLARISDDYLCLPVGAALGFANGQKLIAKERFDLSELANKSIAIPGRTTTANSLYQLFLERARREDYCLYHQVVDKVDNGDVDCGIILHETRFTFENRGLKEIIDLGELWFQRYKTSLPLGCIVVKRNLGDAVISELCQAIRESLRLAFENPSQLREFIFENSIESDINVIDAHIDLFVNQETREISDQGIEAINCFFRAGSQKGLWREVRQDWLFNKGSCTSL